MEFLLSKLIPGDLETVASGIGQMLPVVDDGARSTDVSHISGRTKDGLDRDLERSSIGETKIDRTRGAEFSDIVFVLNLCSRWMSDP